MIAEVNRLIHQALALAPEDRRAVADQLYASLAADESSDPFFASEEIRAAWDAELVSSGALHADLRACLARRTP